MLQSEIVVVLLIFIPRSYKSQNSYIGLVFRPEPAILIPHIVYEDARIFARSSW